jgi:pimeloyl-ACP methyl ester carboxylesterase
VKKKLHKDKIVLVGHSWGSVLGFLMVKARPELFYAFVGTGSPPNLREALLSHTQPLSKKLLAKAIPGPSQN